MLKMMRDRLLIKPIVRELSTIIAVTNKERFNLGEVVAVGPGVERNGRVIPLAVQIGDVVRYGEFVFPEYEEGGVKYQILQEADVAAIVEGDYDESRTQLLD